MQSNVLLTFCLVAAASLPTAFAHGVITAVQGSGGGAFGMVESTPRDGTRTNPFQTDASIIRDREIASGKASACGRTLAGGVNDIAADMQAAASAGMASIGEDGKVRMTLHQVNGDGGGPYICDMDTSATGNSFTPMTIDTNIPGKNSRSRARASDFPLVASMPAGAVCSGGSDGQTCLVRCRNSANAGPFGGCVAVTQAGSKPTKRELSDEDIRQAELAELASDFLEPSLAKRELSDEDIRQAEIAELDSEFA